MPVYDDTQAHRRRLPHLTKQGKTYYVTFTTLDREILPEKARDLILEYCVSQHLKTCWLDTLTVMPDHAHLILYPYESLSLGTVLGRMKGGSSHVVNRALRRRGALWLEESFDRILRSGDSVARKRQYILNNPVRAGLVERPEDYRWNWSSASETSFLAASCGDQIL